ncbi:DUF7504 family protein [Halalkalicoccus ordinarius]|uniref:DUF7504 family protein n=1 Tax=Halalkalicoccus ordinarius TaxID=3116651 RepID=UPI00300E8478
MSQLTVDRSSTLVLSPASTTLDGLWEGTRRLEDLGSSNVLLVVYGESPGAIRDAWRDRIDEIPTRLGVIGVGVADRDDAGDSVSSEGSDVLSAVRDPADASDLGITISLYLQDWATDDAPTVFGFHSLTAMLDHVDVETTFRFLHVLGRRLADTETGSRFYLDPRAVSERTVRTLRPVFNDVVEWDPPATGSLTPDAAYDAIGARRRRYALYHLFENRGGERVETLAAAVARREGVLDSERVEKSLRHAHLPKLEDVGLVSLDSERVVPQGAFAEIEPYLVPAVEHDLPGEEPPF